MQTVTISHYQIPRDVLEATLQYLASRPLGEVLNLFNALQQLSPIETPAEITTGDTHVANENRQ
jgi:hypothetical protein